MNSYFSFQFKKIVKQNLKTIIISVLLIVLFGFLDLDLNFLTNGALFEGQNNCVVNANHVVVHDSKPKAEAQNKSHQAKTEPQSKNAARVSTKDSRLARDEQAKHWHQVYEVSNNDSDELKLSENNYEEKDWLKQTKQFLANLGKHPIPHEDLSDMTGIQLLLELNNKFWPVLFNLVIIFVLSYLFTSSYKDGDDISAIIPIGSGKKFLTNIGVGLLLVSLIYLGLNLVVFLVSSLILGMGNMNYPYIVHKMTNGQAVLDVVPAVKLIPQTIIIQLLEFLLITVYVNLLARIFRHLFPTMLVATFLVAVGSLATVIIEPIRALAAWLPTTYLNSLRAISGSTAYDLNNMRVNFAHGLVTLLLGTLILLVATLFLDRFQQKKSETIIRS